MKAIALYTLILASTSNILTVFATTPITYCGYDRINLDDKLDLEEAISKQMRINVELGELLNSANFSDATTISLLIESEIHSRQLIKKAVQLYKHQSDREELYKVLLKVRIAIVRSGTRFWKTPSQSAKSFLAAASISSENTRTSYIGDFCVIDYLEWEDFLNAISDSCAYYNNIFPGNAKKYSEYNELKLSELSHYLSIFNNITAQCTSNKLNYLQLKVNAAGEFLKKENYASYEIGSRESQSRYFFYFLSAFLISDYTKLGFTDKDMQFLLDKIDTKVYTEFLGTKINQFNNLLNLSKNSFSLIDTSIDNKIVDIKSLNGKIVLIDIWSKYCSSCIGRMPYINKLHNKYKSNGFEVISILIHPKNETGRKLADSIRNKINARWPTILAGSTSETNSLANRLWEEFGFMGVPQMILLDQSSKMIAYNNNHFKLWNGDFENNLVEVLNTLNNMQRKSTKDN